VTGAARPSDDRLREVYRAVARQIEVRWEIPVVIADVPHPFTGDLDGKEIKVDHDLGIEDAVFIVIHLFGHTVQWNVSADARKVAEDQRIGRTSWTDDDLEAVGRYEREACAYSLQLLHDCGIHDLDQWISDFAACDAAYLMHFYRTGEKREFRSFWRDGQPAVAPLPIPDFSPKAWIDTWSGLVV
jgi:hypothetical protein